MRGRWFQNRKKRLRLDRTCRRLKVNDADLTEIDWDDDDVTDSDLTKMAKALPKNTALQELHLCENDISKVGASELMFALRSNGGVRELWLSVNNICDDGAASMSGLLRHNSTLTWLNLNENNITSEGAAYIASGLRKNETLEYLWLNGNRICDTGAEALAGALGTNGSIQLFSLAENRIGEAGAEALADAVRTNRSVSVLGLYGNFMGDAGAEALAAALDDNSTLTELYLGRNGITSRGAVAFAAALRSGNASLLKLWLAQNRVDDEGATALAYALTANATLQEINLGRNDITKRGARALAEALQTNTVLASTGLGGSGDDEGEGEADNGEDSYYSEERSRGGRGGQFSNTSRGGRFSNTSRGGRFSHNSAASRCLARMSNGMSYGSSYNSSHSHDRAAGAAAASYESERRISAAGSAPEDFRLRRHPSQLALGDEAIVEVDSETGSEDVKIGTDARWQRREGRSSWRTGGEANGVDEGDNDVSDDTEEPQRTAGVHADADGRSAGSVPSPSSSFASGTMRDDGVVETAGVKEPRDSAEMEERQSNGKEGPCHVTPQSREAKHGAYAKTDLPDSSQQHQQWDRAKEEEPVNALSQGLDGVVVKDDTHKNAQTVGEETVEEVSVGRI